MRALLMAACAAFVLGAGPASAHAFLKKAEPAVGSTVPQPPTQVAIEFTEGVEPKFSTIAIQDAAGASVSSGDVHLAGDDTHLVVGLKPLPPGTYKVTWHATAVDTHKTEGSFTFTDVLDRTIQGSRRFALNSVVVGGALWHTID